MKILTYNECSPCNRTGVIRNTFYDELDKFIKEYRINHNGERPAIEEEDSWLHAKGLDYWPAEELQCENCDGNGVYEKWIDIEELARIIKATET